MNRLMRKSLHSLAVGALVLTLNPVSATTGSVETFRGVARNTATGQIAYIEDHRVIYQAGRHQQNDTRYLDSAGKEFAVLNSNFTGDHPYVPSYLFEDRRFGRKDGTRVQGDLVTAFGRESTSAPLTEESLKLTDNMITGQGLHFFIRDHLAELAQPGTVKRVDFLIPLEGKQYTFRIQRLVKPSDKPGILTFKIDIDNPLLRLFAPQIEVQYEEATKRLVSYRGASNLLSAEQGVQDVVITYTYRN